MPSLPGPVVQKSKSCPSCGGKAPSSLQGRNLLLELADQKEQLHVLVLGALQRRVGGREVVHVLLVQRCAARARTLLAEMVRARRPTSAGPCGWTTILVVKGSKSGVRCARSLGQRTGLMAPPATSTGSARSFVSYNARHHQEKRWPTHSWPLQMVSCPRLPKFHTRHGAALQLHPF